MCQSLINWGTSKRMKSWDVGVLVNVEFWHYCLYAYAAAAAAAAAAAKSLQPCLTRATSQRAAHQASPSLGFSRQEHWSGLPFPSPTHESEK